MKKLFTKVMAVVSATAVVAALVIGVNFAQTAKADSSVTITNFSFSHQGVNTWGEAENFGRINSVTMASGEQITGWQAAEQELYSTQPTNGFTVNIMKNGWDAKWGVGPNGEDGFNPWSVQAHAHSTMEAGHMYEVSFSAKASKKKYAFITFGTEVDGVEMTPYAEAGMNEGSDDSLIVLNNTPKTFTYKFTDFVSGEQLTTGIMLGAFDGIIDYAGNNRSDIITELETQWNGTVTVSDFTIIDKGLDPRFVPPETTPVKPTQQPTTQSPTQAPTQAPSVQPTSKAPTPSVKTLGKVSGVKVKNTKKKTIKVTWKKVANAKKYQIKVNGKTYTSNKASKTIKNKKFKKKKKVKVQVRAMANGYTTGAWSKKVTKKLKK